MAAQYFSTIVSPQSALGPLVSGVPFVQPDYIYWQVYDGDRFKLLFFSDLLWSVALKPLVRRARPYWHTQHQIATVETVDQYSFPSGHSARAVYMAAFAWHLARIGSTPLYVQCGCTRDALVSVLQWPQLN